ncbi:MAG: response regulator transcription factor [Phycisphaeraceae bacterium]
MSRPRILIADDEQHIVSLLSMTLRKRGYEVLTADNGYKALELAAAFKVDLFIVDQSMPGMTGTTLSQKLAGTAPVLMVTARPEITGQDQPDIAGVIHKPFSPKELAGRIESLIGPGQPPKEHSA